MSSSALRKTPARLPSVEIAYRRPATRPVSSTARTLRRTAYGATQPRTSTGVAMSTSTASSDPANAPAWTLSSACTDTRRNGPAANGTAAMSAAASSTSRLIPPSVGSRSASLPPTQYPAESARSTVAMVFAHTMVEAPMRMCRACPP